MIFTTALGGGHLLLFFLLVRKLRLREVKEFLKSHCDGASRAPDPYCLPVPFSSEGVM